KKCRCSDYENRKVHVPECIKLTPGNIEDLEWMPPYCAYRRLHEGKPLPQWHPLITGDPESGHKGRASIRGQPFSESKLADPEDALAYGALDLLRDKSDDPVKD